MSTSADSLVREAIAVYRAGNKSQARNLLLQAVDLDEHHEQAWLWLSAVVDSVEDQITCLENVLTINPNNEKAKQGIQILNEKLASASTEAPQELPEEVEEDPFAGATFTSNVPESHAVDETDIEDELPEGVSWGSVETSSASAQRPANEPDAAEYGDWIAGLNIGSNEAQGIFGEEQSGQPIFSASPFIDDEGLIDEGTPFEISDDVFGFDEDASAPADEPFSATPFSASVDFDSDLPASQPPPTPTTAVPATPAVSPRSLVSAPDTDLMRDDLDDDLFDNDEFFEDDYDDADLGSVDPQEFFKFIPAEIRATRMPGTNERYPAPVIVGLLLLVVMNIGALALVYFTLSGAV
jgi:hypothetical protein